MDKQHRKIDIDPLTGILIAVFVAACAAGAIVDTVVEKPVTPKEINKPNDLPKTDSLDTIKVNNYFRNVHQIIMFQDTTKTK